MTTSNHPELEQLNAFARQPHGEEFRQLRLHLVTCRDCRKQVSMLAEMHDLLPGVQAKDLDMAISNDDSFSQALHNQQIERYVDGQLDDGEKQAVAAMLGRNGQALKAALHYASHSAKMASQVDRAASGEQGVKAVRAAAGDKGLIALLYRCLTFRSPFWLTVPATAVLAGVLSVVLVPQLTFVADKSQVVAYQDNPVIQFKRSEDLPGIGFFSSADKTSQPYRNITVKEIDSKSLHLSWPKVDNAMSYTMQLKIFSNGQQMLVDTVTTADEHARLKRAANDHGVRYVWHLTGKTGKGELFSTKGGFVIKSEND